MQTPAPTVPQDLPTPMDLAAESLKNQAADHAKSAAWKQVRKYLYRNLPKPLHPLIPGHRRGFAEEAGRAVSRWFWGLVTTLIFGIFFFGIFAFFILLILGIVVGAIMGVL